MLQEECAVHERYIAAVHQEQKQLVKFQVADIEKTTVLRTTLAQKIYDLHQKRVAYLGQLPESGSSKMSELLVKNCHPEEVRMLAPLIKKLRKLIIHSKRYSEEMNQNVDFSLKFIGGTLSLLWSATQNITKGYTRKGVVKERLEKLPAGSLSEA